jgi:hypothetical protein
LDFFVLMAYSSCEQDFSMKQLLPSPSRVVLPSLLLFLIGERFIFLRASRKFVFHLLKYWRVVNIIESFCYKLVTK